MGCRRKLYHFTSPEAAEAILRGKNLRLSRFENSNDPSELLAVDQSDKAFRTHYNRYLDENVRNTWGYLSFSKSWDSPLMWSHYADRHRGVCLEFDGTSGSKPFFDVQYSKKRIFKGITIEGFSEFVSKDNMVELLGTKAKGWEYEQEVRYMHRLKDRAIDFGPKLKLSKVYLGPRTHWGTEDIEDFFGSAIPTVPTRIAFKTFKVVPQGEKSLWKTRA